LGALPRLEEAIAVWALAGDPVQKGRGQLPPSPSLDSRKRLLNMTVQRLLQRPRSGGRRGALNVALGSDTTYVLCHLARSERAGEGWGRS